MTEPLFASSTTANTTLIEYTSPKVLLGLLGVNILKSLSPAMHQEEGRQQGLRVFYQLMDLSTMHTRKHPQGASVDDLERLLESALQMGFAGVNITYPCKQAVLPLLDHLSNEAKAVGAVNTVVFKQGETYGYNTDCSGYSLSLQARLGDRPLGRVVLVGTGGAGAAVAHGVMGLGAQHITLVDTDLRKAHDLADNLIHCYGAQAVDVTEDAQHSLKQANGLINATPLGMAGIGGMCVPGDWLQSHHWVSDVVYSPLDTELIRVAKSKGCTTIDGGGMNLLQAAKAFELFTGLTPHIDRMAAYQQQLFTARGL